MYVVLASIISAPNLMRRRQGAAPLKSLDLTLYGETGREASDQLHDRLMAVEWVRKSLGPVNKHLGKYGAIVALGKEIGKNLQIELEAEAKAVEAAKTEGEDDD